MISKALQPLSNEDAEKLRRRAACSWLETVALAVLFPLGGFAVGGLGKYLLEMLGHSGHEWLAVVGAVTGCTVGVLVVVILALFQRRLRRLLAIDLQTRQLEVYELQPREVVEAVLTADQPAYFLDLADNQMLFLCGQWLLDPQTYGLEKLPPAQMHQQMVFPCKRFRLYRAPQSGIILKIELLSEGLAPSRRLKPKEVAAPTYADSLFFEGRLATLGEDLQRTVVSD